jgi:hypothetical protein
MSERDSVHQRITDEKESAAMSDHKDEEKKRRCPCCHRVIAVGMICLACLGAAAPMRHDNPDAPEREPASVQTMVQVAKASSGAASLGWLPQGNGEALRAVHAHWVKEAAIGAGYFDVFGNRPLPAATATSS